MSLKINSFLNYSQANSVKKNNTKNKALFYNRVSFGNLDDSFEKKADSRPIIQDSQYYEGISNVIVEEDPDLEKLEKNITVGDNVELRLYIYLPNGSLKAGDNFNLRSLIKVGKDLTLGNNATIQSGIKLLGGKLNAKDNLKIKKDVLIKGDINVKDGLEINGDFTSLEGSIFIGDRARIKNDLKAKFITDEEQFPNGGNITVGDNIRTGGSIYALKNIIIGDNAYVGRTTGARNIKTGKNFRTDLIFLHKSADIQELKRVKRIFVEDSKIDEKDYQKQNQTKYNKSLFRTLILRSDLELDQQEKIEVVLDKSIYLTIKTPTGNKEEIFNNMVFVRNKSLYYHGSKGRPHKENFIAEHVKIEKL